MATKESNNETILSNLGSNFKTPAKNPLEQFEIDDCIGEGCSGKVYKVHFKSDYKRAPFALKVLNTKKFACEKQKEHLDSEISVLRSVSHPFIVKMLKNFERSGYTCMLFEYLSGGDLHDRLTHQSCFGLEDTKFYAAQVMLALQYLHSNDIIFRDLKPENILIDKQGFVKLADFGFSKILKQNSRTFTLCGTPEYLSPEFLTKKAEGYGKSIDWWAFGVLMYEMLVGKTPFLADTPAGIYRKILKREIVFPKHVDCVSRNLILKFLNPSVEQRLGCPNSNEDMKAHPFFENICFQDLLKRNVKPPASVSTANSSSSLNKDCSLNSEIEQYRFSEVEIKFKLFNCLCL